MATITTVHKIVAGHNNAGTLQLVTDYSDANSVGFIMPRTITSRGLAEKRSNGLTRWRGYPSAIWRLPLLVAQYDYIYTNLLGAVTISASLDGGLSYANYNAYSWLPELSTIADTLVDFAGASGVGMPSGWTGPGWPSVDWEITKLVAI